MAEATKKSTNTRTSWARKAKGGEGKACSIEGCKRPHRAKSYCFFHYKKWRQGDLPHSRYNTCSKPDCRKKRSPRAGLCEQHFNEAFKKEEAA